LSRAGGLWWLLRIPTRTGSTVASHMLHACMHSK
jgi:hypothetical protein